MSLRGETHREDKRESSYGRQQALFDLAKTLHTGLDKKSVQICADLIKEGVNPEALAWVVLELRRETERVRIAALQCSNQLDE
mmetsp:Transcript_5852/g.11623  ORF Transcript_5852/g.11623 Transcript_5852/m.11623 type:complete len:83 (+) Transcript_5852:347-595(+)